MPGHNSHTGQLGTYNTLANFRLIQEPSSAMKTYVATPMPSTAKPEALPCNIVGWFNILGAAVEIFNTVCNSDTGPSINYECSFIGSQLHNARRRLGKIGNKRLPNFYLIHQRR